MSVKADILNSLNFARRIQANRLFNAFMLRLSYFISRLTKRYWHAGMPEALSVEPTNLCNLSCVGCPVGQHQLKRPEGKIDSALYDKILQEAGTFLFHLNLYFQGEPFLHRAIFDLIQKAHQRNIYVTISTNGHFLHDERQIDQLIESKLDKLIVSIDGISQETYQKYRKAGHLDKVLKGLELLSRKKKKKNAPLPYIEVQFIAFQHNESEIPLLDRFFAPYNIDKLSIKTAFVDDLSKAKGYLPKTPGFKRYQENEKGQYVLKRSREKGCWRSWHAAVITWDGVVVPCCFDKEAAHAYGNLSEQSLSSVWKNQHAKAFRKQVLKEMTSVGMCTNCVEGVKYKA